MEGALILAAKSGNKESLLAALDRDPDINEKDDKGLTALHWAALKNNNDTALLLLEKGAGVDAVDHINGVTPLHWAAQNNSKDTVLVLLEHGAHVNAVNEYQNTSLHWTSFRDCHETALVLLSHGVDVDAVNKGGSTALHTAAANNSAKVVRLLLQHKANVNSVDHSDNSALHLAAMNNRDEIISILIQYGANMNLANVDGRTPLHFAVNYNCKKAAFILVNKGADVKLVGPHGNTVLHWAVENNNKELVQYLIDRGADVNAEKRDGSTVLHIAAANNNLELVTFLVEHIANINAKDGNGDTALILSSKTSKEVALLLVDHGADVNVANEHSFPHGHTALHWAATRNNRELAICLLTNSADVNTANRIGDTALHSAAEFNSKEVAHLLMEHDANVNAVNRNDETPLNLAVRNNCKDVALQLLQRDANVRVRNKDGSSVLHWAATYKNEELSLLLLRHGVDVNTVNDGETALHCAARENSLSVAQLLVQHGANVNAKDKDGNTPLHFAVDKNSKDICLFLLTHGAVADTLNKNGNNALHLASNTDDKELASVLAENIGQVDILNMDGDTALHRAVTGNNGIVAAVLLDHGADVKALNKAGNTPLHCACMQVTGEAMIRLLLSKGAVVDCRNKMGLTALHFAVTDGNFNMVVLLLEHGAKVNLTDDFGNSPLHLAILNKKFQVSRLLLKQPNVHVNKLDEDGKSPFHLLAQVPVVRNDLYEIKNVIAEIARDLLKNGASVNIRNILDQTPLHLARNVCTTQVLLESGAWPNVRENYGGNTPLLSQAKSLLKKRAYFGEQSELEKVVGKGMDPWIANDDGETVLGILLAQAKDFEGVRSLIHVMKGKNNCNINKKHSNGDTLMHIVCTRRKDEALELLDLLFKSHANVNDLNAFSETPLHLVCRAICQLPEGSISSPVFHWSAGQLVAHGADPTLKDRNGETCLHIARDVPQLLSLLTSPVDLMKVPQLLKWSEPKSHKHKSKVAEVVRGRNSFQIQNYHCHKETIGKGGFSLVYAGVDEKDGREVAVKSIMKDRLCRPEDQREIASLVKLCNCEDVVRYFCCIDQKRFIYIILELMEGTLDDLLNDPRESIRDVKLSVTLCQDVVRGLCFFHDRNVLHRDIKPGNILYKKSPRLCLKIADFGLSTSAASVETTSVMHTFAGTRCWMAPELLQGPRRFAHSFESDVFACGLVLHYILDEKKHPFSPAAEKGIERSIIDLQNGTERNIMMQNLNISEQLTAEARHLIEMMLSKGKESRPIAGAIIGHPLFWSKKKKLRFLNAVGNQPEFQAPRHIVREHSAVEKELENSLDPTFATDPWDYAVYPTFVEMTSSGGRRYNTCSTIDLVRFVRNAQAHVSDTSRSTQFKQDVLESFVFLEKFPSLLIEVYKAITSNGWEIVRAEIKSVLFDE